jgi:hypothetical protein
MDETPEQIHARLMGMPAPAEAPKEHAAPSKELESPAPAEASYVDQHGDEDAATREARESVDTYKNLYQLGRQEAEESNTPLNRLTTAVTDNALGIIGGHYAGKALRKLIPEKYQYDPSVPEIESTHLPATEQELGKYHNAVLDEVEAKNAARDQHIQEGQALKGEADNRRIDLQMTERELTQAREDLLKSKQIKPEQFMPLEQVETKPSAPERAELNIKPIGGSAAEKYGLAHGLTEDEAKRVASASKVQKENIPAQAEAFERLKSIAPNVVMSEESNLALDPAAQKVVEERKAKQLQQQAQQQKLAEQKEAQRQAAVQKTIDLKEAAKERVDLLERQRKENLDRVMFAEKAHRDHMKLLPQMASPTPEQQRELDKYMKQIDEMKQKVAQQTGSATKTGRVLKYIGQKGAGFVPYIGAAMSVPLAATAKEEYAKGNPIRGGLYTLGSLGSALQASNNLYAMGAGDIMQIPATGLGLYDILRGD